MLNIRDLRIDPMSLGAKKLLVDKPDGFVEVEFSGLEIGAYETKEGVRFTAKATGIALANRKA